MIDSPLVSINININTGTRDTETQSLQWFGHVKPMANFKLPAKALATLLH